MSVLLPQTFNPEILYICDTWSEVGQSSPIHHHDFLELSFILEGESYYTLENESGIPLHAGQLLVLNPGFRHGEAQIQGCSHQLHVGIRNVSLTGLSRNFMPNEAPLVDLGKFHHQVMEQAWLLQREAQEEETEARVMQKAIVMKLLVLILRGLAARNCQLQPKLSATAQRQQRIVDYTVYYLENHYEEEITLERLAHDQYISPAYLSKIFKEATGMSPINYLINIRLNRAKELLHHEHLTVKEIASTVGYQDAYHFSKSFKKQFGIAPSSVASHLQEK